MILDDPLLTRWVTFFWLAQSEPNIRTDLRPGPTRPDQTRPRPDRDLLIFQLWAVLEGWNFVGTSSSVKNSYSIKDQNYKLQSGTSSILQSPHQDKNDMEFLYTFKIEIESQTLDHGYIKDQWPYPNQDQDAKPQSGTSNISKNCSQDSKSMDDHCTFKFM